MYDHDRRQYIVVLLLLLHYLYPHINTYHNVCMYIMIKRNMSSYAVKQHTVTYSLYITIHDSSGSAPAEAAIHCVLGEVFVAHQFRTAMHLCSQTRRNGSGRMLRRREFPEILDKRI